MPETRASIQCELHEPADRRRPLIVAQVAVYVKCFLYGKSSLHNNRSYGLPMVVPFDCQSPLIAAQADGHFGAGQRAETAVSIGSCIGLL